MIRYSVRYLLNDMTSIAVATGLRLPYNYYQYYTCLIVQFLYNTPLIRTAKHNYFAVTTPYVKIDTTADIKINVGTECTQTLELLCIKILRL